MDSGSVPIKKRDMSKSCTAMSWEGGREGGKRGGERTIRRGGEKSRESGRHAWPWRGEAEKRKDKRKRGITFPSAPPLRLRPSPPACKPTHLEDAAAASDVLEGRRGRVPGSKLHAHHVAWEGGGREGRGGGEGGKDNQPANDNEERETEGGRRRGASGRMNLYSLEAPTRGRGERPPGVPASVQTNHATILSSLLPSLPPFLRPSHIPLLPYAPTSPSRMARLTRAKLGSNRRCKAVMSFTPASRQVLMASMVSARPREGGREGRAEGRREGRAEGRREGRAEGGREKNGVRVKNEGGRDGRGKG